LQGEAQPAPGGDVVAALDHGPVPGDDHLLDLVGQSPHMDDLAHDL
jgi:hypothetical protein